MNPLHTTSVSFRRHRLILTWAFLMLTFLFHFTELRAQTFNNGNLSTGALNNLNQLAPSGYNWSELQSGNSNLGFNARIDSFAVADNFTVTCGPWNVTKFTFYTYITGFNGSVSPVNDVRVVIYNTDPSIATPANIVFGNLSTNRFSSSSPAFLYRVGNGQNNTDRQIWQVDAAVNTVLPNGTYWVVFSLGNTLGQRCLVPASTVVGSTTQAGNNAQQLTVPSLVWGALTDVGGPQDLPFGIQYTTPACTGTPNPGNTVSTSASVCPSIPFTLSLQNPTCGFGINHQWQTAPLPTGPWTNIPSATNNTLTTTLNSLSLPAGAYFRDNVTCGATPGPSVPIQITAAPLTSCYCIPLPTDCSSDDDIRNVTYFGLNNSTTDCVNNGYSDFTSIPFSPFAVLSGVSRPISVTVGPGGFESVAVWIDYNQNGIFESSEFTFVGSGFAFTNPITFTTNITIPGTALNGVTRMRVRSRFNTNLTAGDACIGYDFGQTEDYRITISAAPNCSGTPPVASISASVSNVCPGNNFTLSVTNSNSLGNAAGLSFQWQSSPDGVTWTSIPAATGFTFITSQTATTRYRFVVTCSNSALNTPSNVALVSMSPANVCYCVPTSNGADNDIITNVTFGCINNNSGIHLNGAGYSDYTTTTWPAPLNSTNGVAYRSVTNPISVRSLNAWTEYIAVWIDYNQSGTFDSDEYTYIGTTAPAVGPGPAAVPIVLNSNISIPATALLGVTRMRVRCIFSTIPGPTNACTNYTFGETEDYLIDIRNPVTCSGAISVGSLIRSDDAVCLGENVSIYPNNACDLTGLTGAALQWQSSTDGGVNWVNIPGPAGTAITLNITVIGTTLFRLQVTCGAASGTSPTTSVALNPSSACYCTSGASVSNNSDISNVTLGSAPSILNNTSDCNSAAPGTGSITNQYSNYTSGPGAPTAPIIYSGASNAFGVSLISCVGTAASAVAIWIDMNKNGIFEELGGYTEKLYVSSVSSGVYPRTESGFLTLPTVNNLGDTIRGITRMRIVNQATTSPSSILPCGIYNFGETEDYLVDIRYAPVCNASFVPAISASANPVCPSVPFTLSVTNATGISALSFQWQVSTDGGVNYTDIVGATNATYSTNITAARCYRVISTCGPSATVNTSAGICVNINNNPLQCYCIPNASTAGVSAAITNVTFGSINNTTSWVTPGYTYYPSPIANATRDANNNISVTVSSGGSGTYFLGCWIDFNQNGQFETSEFRSLGTTSTGGTVNTTVNVPATALIGVTRMRIRLSRGVSLTDASSCTTITNGETEDYQVNINNCVPVDFEAQPNNSIITCGSNGGFQVSASSASGALTYQWLVRTTPGGSWTPLSNGPVYGGVTTASLSITAPPFSFNGYAYRVAVSASCTTPDSSAAASLVINPAGANVVTTQPANTTANCGFNASFSFAAAAGAGVAYQWQVRPNASLAWSNITNAPPFSGATTTTLTVAGLTNALSGYQFRAYVTSTCNSADTTVAATLTVAPISLSLSITSDAPSNVICNGSPVTFTANTVYSGPLTVGYRWFIDNIATANAASVGTTINVASTAQLAAGMVVSVFSGAGSFAGTTSIVSITNATSFVVSAVPPVPLANGSVISAYLPSAITNVFTTSNLGNGNQIRCRALVNDGSLCTSPNPAFSNTITMTVNPNTTTAVALSTPTTTLCANTSTVFTATPTNPGASPQYQFFIGNTPVQGPGSSNTFTTSALTNGQEVKVRMTSNANNCPSPNPARDSLTLTVNPSFPVSVSLSANPGGSGSTINICGGIPVEFTAAATNPGTSPNYQFRVNGSVVQNSSSNTYTTSTLANGDVVDCILTSSITSCAPGNPATSNAQTVSIQAQTASVGLTFSPNPACAGSTVTYTASATNGGSPAFLFYVNGVLQSTTGNTFSYIPSQGDSVSVEMASSLPCALPNPATNFIIQQLQTSPTATISVSSLTCSSGSVTLDAGAVAGSGTITGIQWQLAGVNIAGATSPTYFTTNAGSYTVTVTNSNGCSFTSAPFSATVGSAGPLSGIYTIGAITAANVTGSTTTLSCTSTANLTVGAILTRLSGAGTLASNTVITGILNATQFTVNTAPTVALSGAVVAGTTCTNYISIAAAVTDLNARTINGNCTFNVPAGYVENLTARIDLGSAALNPTLAGRTVTFQKSGAGLNPVLNAYTGTGTPSTGVADGMWALSGADNITIDGINLFDGNASNWMEYGFGFFKLNLSDGAQNNTIKNCTVSLKRENNATAGALVPEGSTGILFNNSTSAAPNSSFGGTVASGANSNNKIYSDSIINCNNGIALVGYASTVSPFTDGDTGNDIGGISIATGNTILNFGGATVGTNPASGIRASNQWGLNISYNKIDNNLLPGGSNHNGPLTGIRGISGTSANVTINNNNLNIKGGGNFAVSAIENAIGSTPAGNTVNINNNTVTGSHASSSTATYFAINNTATAANLNMNGNTVSGFTFPASSGEWRGVYNAAIIGSTLNMNSNTVSNNTINSTNPSCTFIFTATSATLTTAAINGNTVTDNTRPISAAVNNGQLDFIRFSSSANCNLTVNGNIVRNNVVNIQTTGTFAQTINGINFGQTSTLTVTNNTIQNVGVNINIAANVVNLRGIAMLNPATISESVSGNLIDQLYVQTTNATTSTSVHLLDGIVSTGGTGIRNIFNNTIQNIYATAGYSSGISGIRNAGGASTLNIYRNRVFNLFPGQNTTSNNSIAYGIRLSNIANSGSANVYNNMVSIDLTNATAPAANGVLNASDGIRGIDISATANPSSINVISNTVRLAGAGTVNFGSSAFFHAASTTGVQAGLILRNNIFVNECTPVGTGVVTAIRRSAAALNNYATTSDHNNLFVASGAGNRTLYTDGTNSYATLATVISNLAPREANSKNAQPSFLSTTDLHLQSCGGGNAALDGTGSTASLTLAPNDFDDEVRSSPPDIGADEFNGNSFSGRVQTSTTACPGINSGTLNLTGASGTVTTWEFSTDSTNWTPIASTGGLNSYSYSNLTVKTWFRAQVNNLVCNATQPSLPASVSVFLRPQISLTNGGTDTASAQLCNATTLNLFGNGTPAVVSPWISANTTILTISNGGVVSAQTVGGPVNVIYTNSNGCKDTVAVTVNALPSISGTLTSCAGINTTVLTGSTLPLASGTTWSSSNPAVATVSGNLSTTSVNALAGGTTNITYTSSAGCVSAPVIFTVNARPIISLTSGGASAATTSLCAGSSANLFGTPTANTTDPWVSSNTGVLTINGSGFMTASTTTGSSTVTYTNSNGCANTISVTVIASPTVTGTLSACVGNNTTVLTGSGTPAASNAWTSSNTAVATVSGNLVTTTVNAVAQGTSTITYTNSSGCQRSVIFTVNALPTLFNVTGGGAYCFGGTGVSIGLSGSQSGVNYQLVRQGSPNVNVGTPVPGNTSAISFGLQTVAGTYIVTSVNPTTGCTRTMTGSVVVTVNALPVITGTLSVCSGGSSSLTGTPGPAASNAWQISDPSVATISSTGLVNAVSVGTADITYTDVNGCVQDTVFSVSVPSLAGNATGTTAVCTGNNSSVISVSGNTGSVQWQSSPDGVTFTNIVGATNASYTAVNLSADTYYRAVVTNGGCAADTTNNVVISVNPLPAAFNVTGTGAICAGSNGRVIGLSGSQTGVRYQLVLSPSTNVGLPVTGTGSAISFGTIATAGTYTVTATNNFTLCSAPMTGNAVITVNPIPTDSIAPPGPTVLCEGSTQVLTAFVTNGGAATYKWYKDGVLIPGATSSTYTVTSTTGSSIYQSAVTNTTTGCASLKSKGAVVSFVPRPANVTVTPDSSAVCSGGAGQSLVASADPVTNTSFALLEDFNGSTPWTVSSSTLSPVISNWAIYTTPFNNFSGSAQFTSFYTQDSGRFAQADADAGGFGTTTLTSLNSPSFNLVNYSDASLVFEHALRLLSGDSARVDVSTDGGTTWTLLRNYTANAGNTASNAQTTVNDNISMDAYVNLSDVRVRFYYRSAWGYYWILDNIRVTGTKQFPLNYTWSPAAGLSATTGASVTANPTSSTVYTVTASTANGCSNPGTAEVNIIANPVVNSITPLAANICVSGSQTITASVTGDAVTYTWRKDGVPVANGGVISGQGTPALTLTNPTAGDAGSYTVVVEGTCGVPVTSAACVVTITTNGTWLGLSNNWSDPANWCGGIPSAVSNITIPAGRANYPVISSSGPSCNNITILAGASVTVGTNGRLAISGILSNTGVFNAKDGTIEMAGTTAQTIPANAFQNNNLRNLVIANNSVTLGGNLNLLNKLSFIGSNRTFATAGFLTLKSSDTLTASVGDITNNNTTTGNQITGDVQVERYISGWRAWRFLSMPTKHNLQTIKQAWQENAVNTSQNPSPGFGMQLSKDSANWNTTGFDIQSSAGGPSVKFYQNSGWKGITSTINVPGISNGRFELGKAYMTFFRGDRTVNSFNPLQTTSPSVLREKGEVYTGNFGPISVPSGQFEAIGNPYASAINFANFDRTNIDGFYYLWDPKIGALGAYQTFTTSGNCTPCFGSYGDPNVVGAVHPFIESGQGFFVRNSSASAGSITIRESSKVDSSYLVTRQALNNTELRANLFISPSGNRVLYDGVLSIFDPVFSNGVDAEDVAKLTNFGENLSLIRNGSLLSIEQMGHPQVGDTLFYRIGQLRQQTYQFEFTPKLMDQFGLKAELEDLYLNTRTDISLTAPTVVSFAITSDAASAQADRFRIVFRPLAPVPVTFVDVRAERKGRTHLVSWNVQNELNIRQYTVERSADGRTFNAIGQVAANGAAAYALTDLQPVWGDNFYRIRSSEVSGQYQYSKVVKLTYTGVPEIAMSPNPVNEDRRVKLSFRDMPGGTYQLRILNALGQVVQTRILTHTAGTAVYDMELTGLSAHGSYHVEVRHRDSGTMTLLKFVF